MKKLKLLLISASIVSALALTGCGNKADTKGTDNTGSKTTQSKSSNNSSAQDVKTHKSSLGFSITYDANTFELSETDGMDTLYVKNQDEDKETPVRISYSITPDTAESTVKALDYTNSYKKVSEEKSKIGTKDYDAIVVNYQANTDLVSNNLTTYVVSGEDKNMCFIIEVNTGKDTDSYNNAIKDILASFTIN